MSDVDQAKYQMTEDWISAISEYLIVSIHTILHSTRLYDPNSTVKGESGNALFMRRLYLGVAVWQCRHPEVCSYIEQVIAHSKLLIEQNLVDRVIFVIESAEKGPLQHITMKISREFDGSSFNSLNPSQPQHNKDGIDWRASLEEELRSMILRLGMLEGLISPHTSNLPEDCEWKLMVVTKSPSGSRQEKILQESLTSGLWYIDNNQLSEVIARSQSLSGPHNPTKLPESISPRLIPIKSYRDHYFNLSLYAHIFS